MRRRASEEIPQIGQRKVKRGGTVYDMDRDADISQDILDPHLAVGNGYPLEGIRAGDIPDSWRRHGGRDGGVGRRFL